VAFIVYNAYPNRAEANTWEKRVKCVSWLFGCYKSVVRQVEGQCAPAPRCRPAPSPDRLLCGRLQQPRWGHRR